jgi:DNA invertase Pin-like site-specific DNA recombinase
MMHANQINPMPTVMRSRLRSATDDPTRTGAGVNRQIEDARALCARRGWTPAPKDYVDNDLSAYKRTVVRPAFERMLKDLKSGALQGIVVYDLDRFSRQPRDLERAIDIYERTTDLVFASIQGDFDLAGDGKLMARVISAFANKSSADTARRVKRKHLELARAGIPVGGTRPFGWLDDKVTLHQVEAQLVRDGVGRLLAGLSARSLASEWNAAGVTTTVGNPWEGKTVRQYMRNPRLAGYRNLKGEPVIGDDGAPVMGRWEPILSADDFDRLTATLTNPETRVRVPRKGKRQYLLSGVARCGICAAVMYGNRRGSATGLWYYVCGKANGHTMSASGPAMDALIEAAIMARLTTAGAVPVEASEWAGRARYDTIKRDINETMKAFQDGLLSSGTAFPTVAVLEG